MNRVITGGCGFIGGRRIRVPGNLPAGTRHGLSAIAPVARCFALNEVLG